MKLSSATGTAMEITKPGLLHCPLNVGHPSEPGPLGWGFITTQPELQPGPELPQKAQGPKPKIVSSTALQRSGCSDTLGVALLESALEAGYRDQSPIQY